MKTKLIFSPSSSCSSSKSSITRTRTTTRTIFAALVCVLTAVSCATVKTSQPAHTFAIGTNDFLLDGQRFQIRCGEIHAARVPHGILAATACKWPRRWA